LPPLSRRQARPALVMGAVYENLLNRLEAENFQVFGPRVRLPVWRKFLSVAGVLKDEWT